jgi:hypothetical protein
MPFEYVLLISTYNNRTLLDIQPRPTWASRLEYYLYNLSLLHVALEEKISLLRRETLDNQRFRTVVRVRLDTLADWRAMYRRRLDEIATVCREHGTTLFVGAEPQRFYDSRLDQLAPGDAPENREAHGSGEPGQAGLDVRARVVLAEPPGPRAARSRGTRPGGLSRYRRRVHAGQATPG